MEESDSACRPGHNMSDSWDSSSSAGEEEFLCDYEKKRLENIRKNQEMLKSLGKGLTID